MGKGVVSWHFFFAVEVLETGGLKPSRRNKKDEIKEYETQWDEGLKDKTLRDEIKQDEIKSDETLENEIK